MGAKLIHYEEVPAQSVEMEGAGGVTLRWLISKKDGAPNFAMRRFDLSAGGHTPCHSHEWEHEVYILSGRGHLNLGESNKEISPGFVAFIPGGEEHQFKADEGEALAFLCLIPNSGPS